MTREKPDSEWRGMIVDLSLRGSVNSGVDKDMFLDSCILLKYLSQDNIIEKVVQLGLGSHIYKMDISRAFRQLKIDPGDLVLLGLKLGS